MDRILQDLIQEDEPICLVVGRITEITERINGCLVVTCDIAESFSHRHLKFDFNDIDSLKKIPNDLFKIIIVDWSTLRYLFLSKRNVAEQISRIAGRFVIESSVSSIKISNSSESCYEFHNPSHMIISHERFKDMKISESSIKPKSTPLLRLNGGSSRVVIAAERYPSGNESRLISSSQYQFHKSNKLRQQTFPRC